MSLIEISQNFNKTLVPRKKSLFPEGRAEFAHYPQNFFRPLFRRSFPGRFFRDARVPAYTGCAPHFCVCVCVRVCVWCMLYIFFYFVTRGRHVSAITQVGLVPRPFENLCFVFFKALGKCMSNRRIQLLVNSRFKVVFFLCNARNGVFVWKFGTVVPNAHSKYIYMKNTYSKLWSEFLNFRMCLEIIERIIDFRILVRTVTVMTIHYTFHGHNFFMAIYYIFRNSSLHFSWLFLFINITRFWTIHYIFLDNSLQSSHSL